MALRKRELLLVFSHGTEAVVCEANQRRPEQVQHKRKYARFTSGTKTSRGGCEAMFL